MNCPVQLKHSNSKLSSFCNKCLYTFIIEIIILNKYIIYKTKIIHPKKNKRKHCTIMNSFCLQGNLESLKTPLFWKSSRAKTSLRSISNSYTPQRSFLQILSFVPHEIETDLINAGFTFMLLQPPLFLLTGSEGLLRSCPVLQIFVHQSGRPGGAKISWGFLLILLFVDTISMEREYVG